MPALTFAWILYAVILIAIGFQYKARYLRYWSLAIFGATVGKIFLYDLSYLDPGIRVILLMMLGVAMVGGGYWYIRMRPSTVDDSSPQHLTPKT